MLWIGSDAAVDVFDVGDADVVDDDVCWCVFSSLLIYVCCCC